MAELELWMKDQYSDYEISNLTGIKERTIRDWRAMMEYKAVLVDKPRKTTWPRIHREAYKTGKQIRYNSERSLQDAFVSTLNVPYEQYVHIPVGIIDVLTKDTIYEIKIDLHLSALQRALGQIALYSTEYPEHNRVIVANGISISKSAEKAVNTLGVKLLTFDQA